jgi:retron-type reverse transcriptase
MRRAGNLIERIADADNLRLAFWKASRGKRAKATVLKFRENLHAELRELREGLLTGTLEWGPYRTFMIHDPKERMICAAPLRDRVAHHAIMNVAETAFEAYQIHDSYACRKGKGLDGALRRAVAFARQGGWFLKLDIRKYFDSIHHETLKYLLRRRLKDHTVLALFDAIIDSYETAPARGVPIGNLTSQFFANHYLAVLDHHVKETLRSARYVRYMDDFIVWDSERQRLRQVRGEVERFLRSRLRLELKPVCVNRCDRGMTFLGYRVYPHRVGLARRSRRRFREKLRQYHENCERGQWDEQQTARHVEPLLSFVRRGGCIGLRKRMLEQLGLCP